MGDMQFQSNIFAEAFLIMSGSLPYVLVVFSLLGTWLPGYVADYKTVLERPLAAAAVSSSG